MEWVGLVLLVKRRGCRGRCPWIQRDPRLAFGTKLPPLASSRSNRLKYGWTGGWPCLSASNCQRVRYTRDGPSGRTRRSDSF
jgi:hypothetical protein